MGLGAWAMVNVNEVAVGCVDALSLPGHGGCQRVAGDLIGPDGLQVAAG